MRGALLVAGTGRTRARARWWPGCAGGWPGKGRGGAVQGAEHVAGRRTEPARALTGRPVYGVLPWTEGLWLDAEDSLALASPLPGSSHHGPFGPKGCLRIAVVKLPRISNFTDADALAAEPGVLVRFAGTPAELADADLVVLPGSRATVADLGWLRERGLAAAITDRARRGLPVLGICGGYQMLARSIDDPVESGLGRLDGLGLLPGLPAVLASLHHA